MTTLEMMNAAAKTGKVYTCNGSLCIMPYFGSLDFDIRYLEGKGFYRSEGGELQVFLFESMNEILKLKNWEALNYPELTIHEAEKKYKIQIIQ